MPRWPAQNAARNGIALEVREGDLPGMPAALRRDFDHVIANPPYFAPRAARPPADRRARDGACGEDTPLADWVDAATRRLRPGRLADADPAGATACPTLLAALDRRLGSLPLSCRLRRARGPRRDRASSCGPARAGARRSACSRRWSSTRAPRMTATARAIRPPRSAVLRDGADLTGAFG